MSDLPTGWTSATFGDVVTRMSNGMSGVQNKDGNGVPVSRIETIADQRIDFGRIGYVAEFDESHLEKYKLLDGDVLFSHINSPTHLGKTAIFSGSNVLYHGINLLRIQVNRELIAPPIFDFACKFLRYKGEFSLRAQHAVNQSSLNQTKLAAFPISLPPLAEQKRIADKLDTVLSRVDAVNTRLARVAPLLKRFRQSVLAAATSGRLTEDWRKTRTGASALEYQSIELTIPYAHAVTAPKAWTAMRFDEAIDLVGGSQPPKAVFSDVEQDGYVRLIQIRDYKSDKYKTHIPRELARRFCSSSDVMIGRYGPPIFQILRGLEGAYNVALMKAVPRKDIYSNDYLFYFLQKPDLLRYVEAGSDRTAGQDGVNKDHLIKYPVFAPPIDEQTEIVRRVETLFAFADRLEARMAQAQTAATRLTPALLARAFRGELVPQDPNDEPAAELLRRLAQAPAAASPRKGRKAAGAAA